MISLLISISDHSIKNSYFVDLRYGLTIKKNWIIIRYKFPTIVGGKKLQIKKLKYI